MQLAVRLVATLLAVTWITPVVQAATVLRNFTLIDGADQRQVQPEMARVYPAGQGLVFKGCYAGVAGLNQPVADVTAARRAVDQQVAKGVDSINKLWVDDEYGDLPLRMPAEISTAIIDEAHEHKRRAIAHIFYRDNEKTSITPAAYAYLQRPSGWFDRGPK